MSELRDNFALAGSNHVPTSNHSWLLVLCFPQVLRELHFHFSASPLMHRCNLPTVWMHSTQGRSWGCTCTANITKQWAGSECGLVIQRFSKWAKTQFLLIITITLILWHILCNCCILSKFMDLGKIEKHSLLIFKYASCQRKQKLALHHCFSF